ncbi:response regulator transcription factor [Aquabacterium sp. A7-Y]|uniref:response regulator transcription factor n=1 Tax=Aquabacterium sp. A7-Y TaxID=1349605 RepID=UPI00223CD0C8|nr:response regulator transcription factor [Aquabacterium sp. A7-Y]MCW7541691.1 response regulator transcription factor [Aquabacterium sp. A7-Y]
MTAPLPESPLDRSESEIVLIVDDVPDNLAVLHDTLDESGYTVLVATDGESALQRAAQALPDIILLDAVMPGMDGFEVARRLKARAETGHIPIVFMTGLTETEHVVAAFRAGGVDYVNKPIRPQEVLARIVTHVQGARLARQARNALDAFGHATLAVRLGDGRVVWQTPLARKFLQDYLGCQDPQLPEELLDWVRAHRGLPAGPVAPTRTMLQGARRLVVALHQQTGDDEWLLVMREASDAAAIEGLTLALGLTLREAEVLYWVVKGKTNRDIGEILGASPATVKKHLEHVFGKLGVETRTAAASLAIGRVAQLGQG